MTARRGIAALSGNPGVARLMKLNQKIEGRVSNGRDITATHNLNEEGGDLRRTIVLSKTFRWKIEWNFPSIFQNGTE